MPDSSRYGVNIDISAGRDRSVAAPLPDDPFRIAFLGDFRGRSGRDADADEPLASRRAVVVDRDDIDEVMARTAPRLVLDLGEDARVELSFSELEHFHPDRIFERAPFFRALREARTRLASRDTFSSALDSILGGPAAQSRAAPDVHADDVIADTLSGSLLDRMTDGGTRRDSMQAYLRRIVAPHVVPGEDPRRDAMLADLDASVTASMRAVLHHPAFQALESLWRSVDFLVRRLETSATLKLHLLDVTADELRADGAAVAVARVLGGAFAVIVVDHRFGASAEDVDLLLGLGAVAASQGAALLAGARPDLLGIDDFATLPEPRDLAPWQDDTWHALRRSGEAGAVGLVVPRFLLRLPYGENSDPCDRIRLEELDTPPAHETFLWGNGAVAAAALLGESFAAAGWQMRPGQHLEVSRLPVYTWRTPEGSDLKPCAESLMTDRLAEVILEAGPMVLATIRHGDTARLVRFQSIASPPRALQGPWSRVT